MSWITSRHAIEAALERGARGRLLVSSAAGRSTVPLIGLAKRHNISVERVSPSELRRIVGGSARSAALNIISDETVSTVATVRSFLDKLDADRPACVVILDHITDPHNLGAVLRAADVFAVDLVVLAARRSASVNDTVWRTSAGAAAYVPVAVEANLTRAIATFQNAGFWAYAADMDGIPVSDAELASRTVLVLGAEAGLTRNIREACDQTIGIPNHGHVDSLNVSVAAAILMYEYRRGQAISTPKRRQLFSNS